MLYHSSWKSHSKKKKSKKGKILYFEDQVTVTTEHMILVSPSLWNTAVFSFSSQKTMVCHLLKHAGISVTHCIIIKILFCALTTTVTKAFYRFAFGSLNAFHLEVDCFGGMHELRLWASCHFITQGTKQWGNRTCWRIIAFRRNGWITSLSEKYVGGEENTPSAFAFVCNQLCIKKASSALSNLVWARSWGCSEQEATPQISSSPFQPELFHDCEDRTVADLSKWICRFFPSFTDGLSRTTFFL